MVVTVGSQHGGELHWVDLYSLNRTFDVTNERVIADIIAKCHSLSL